MAGFFGSFDLNNNTQNHFWEKTSVFPIKENINISNINISHFTNSKFSDDKLFKESNDLIIGLDGVVLNKKKLVNTFGSPSWESLFFARIREHAKSFLNSLRGEYNGFYYDKIEKTFYLFTNQTATKPMFYSYLDGVLYFSSDYLQLIKSLSHISKLEFENQSIKEFLNQGYINSNRTHFKGVLRLQAGEILKLKSSILIEKFNDWNTIDFNSNSRKKNIEEFNDLFMASIKLEYEKDLEYGYQHVCTLSGGLDSRVNVLCAEKLGFKPKLLLCTSQSDYLDVNIASEIASDLNEKLRFHPLDSVSHLFNIDENIGLNGGLVSYNGSAHILELYDKFYPKNGGIVHSGQIGDGILDSFIKKINNKKESNKGYKNTEIELLYNKAFNSVNNGHWITEKYSYLTSPFMNTDFLTFVLSIPHNQRMNSNFYLKWINDYLPEAKKYKWEKINLRPTKFNHTIGLVLNRFRIGLKNKIYGHELNRSMNPYKYWFQTQLDLLSMFENIYSKRSELTGDYMDLDKIIFQTYTKGTIAQKFNVITLIKMMEIWQGNKNDSEI